MKLVNNIKNEEFAVTYGWFNRLHWAVRIAEKEEIKSKALFSFVELEIHFVKWTLLY